MESAHAPRVIHHVTEHQCHEVTTRYFAVDSDHTHQAHLRTGVDANREKLERIIGYISARCRPANLTT